MFASRHSISFLIAFGLCQFAVTQSATAVDAENDLSLPDAEFLMEEPSQPVLQSDAEDEITQPASGAIAEEPIDQQDPIRLAEADRKDPAAKTPAKNTASALDYKFELPPVELKANSQLNLARSLYEKQLWQQVIDSLDQLLKDAPDQESVAQALFLRGEAAMQLRNYDLALQDFSRLLQVSGGTTRNTTRNTESESESETDADTAHITHTRFRLAEANMLLGNHLQAEEQLKAFRTEFPDHALTAYATPYLAEIVGRAGNTKWARELYRETIEKHPDGPLSRDARYRIALLDYRAADYSNARSALRQWLADAQPEEPNFWTAHYWLAMTEYQLKAYLPAGEQFLSFVEGQPEHEKAASALFHAAESLRMASQHQRASDLYRRVREEWPRGEYSNQAAMAEMRLSYLSGNSAQTMRLYWELQSHEDQSIRDEATRLATESLLRAEQYRKAFELIEPLATSRQSLVTTKSRKEHYKNLFLYALAERGLGNYQRAIQLLHRIRTDLVNEQLAEHVLLERAETHNSVKEYQDAVRQAQDYHQRFPAGQNAAAVRTELVRSLVGMDRLQDAIAEFQQLQTDAADPAEVARAARYLGEHAYKSGDLKTARDAFRVLRSVGQNDGDQVQAMTGLAWIEMKEGNRLEAARLFDQLLRQFPNDKSAAEVRLAHAQNLVAAQKTAKAIGTLRYFVDQPANYPGRAQALYQLAELLRRNPQSIKDANRILDKLLAEYPSFRNRDAALYLAGIVKSKLVPATAAKAFQELVQQHRDSDYWADALYRLAEIAADRDQSAKARELLTKLVSTKRDTKVLPHALYLKGQLESDAKDWSVARESLRDILRQFPESSLVHVARYGIAESFYQEKQYRRALELFEILHRDHRFQTDEAWGAMIRLRLAQLRLRNEDYLAAIDVASEIESNFPKFSLQAEVDYLIGRANASRGEFSAARQAYAKVGRSTRPEDAELMAMAQWMTGETYFHQKNLIPAIKAYEKLLADSDSRRWQAASYLQIGKCYEKLDNLQEARKVYSRLIKKFGEADPSDEPNIVENMEEAKYRLSILDQTQ